MWNIFVIFFCGNVEKQWSMKMTLLSIRYKILLWKLFDELETNILE